MAQTKEEICSAALVLIGENTITSFTDGTTGSNIAGALYTGIKRSALSSFPWTFATTDESLGAVASEEPLTRWAYAYLIPAEPECLRIIGVFVNDKPEAFDRRGEYVFLDVDANSLPVISYIFDAGEDRFPPDFAWALTLDLAIAFANSLDRSDRVATLERQQARAWAIAKSSSSQARAPRQLTGSRLTTER